MSLDSAADDVKRNAERAFEELIARVRAGEASRDVIADIQSRFSGRFEAELAAEFSRMLQSSIGVPAVRTLPIGRVALSDRLYQNSTDVSAAVRQVITEHAKGVAEARELALQLFEGYGFKRDPLKVKAALPKYLRELLRDAEFGASYKALARRITSSAAKTEALKAAYLQALDAVIKGPGQNRIERALRVAQYERNRYFANRIAQTELHRADVDQTAKEVMSDDKLSAVQIVMSQTHPVEDICDLHSGIDRYGLGPGVYPKALAPRPPFHPHCRCLVRTRHDIDARGATEIPGAERAFLRGHPRPAAIMGSKARAAHVVAGQPVAKVLNRGVDPLYHVRYMGDPPLPDAIAGKKPPSSPPPPALAAPLAFDASTPAGRWHSKAWNAAPEWLRQAVLREQSVRVQNETVDAAWAQAGELIEMGGRRDTNAPDLAVWRHEFGHVLDWRAAKANAKSPGQLGPYRSDSDDFRAALAADAALVLKAAGVGRHSKALEAAKAAREARYLEARDAVIGADDRAGHVRALARRVGLDPDAFERLIAEETLMDEVYKGAALGQAARKARMLSAIEQGDAQEFIRGAALLTENDAGQLTHDHKLRRWSKSGGLASLSDLAGAVTKNKIASYEEGFVGHSTSYYQRAAFLPGTEVFANLTALAADPNPAWWAITRTLFPAITAEYERIISTWTK